jgi:hypothetical protein
MKRFILGGLAAALMALPLAGVAHADDASYMAALRAAGAPIFPGLDAGWIGDGHHMCNELRMGLSVENVASEVVTMDPAVYMPILQHELCPDTL